MDAVIPLGPLSEPQSDSSLDSVDPAIFIRALGALPGLYQSEFVDVPGVYRTKAAATPFCDAPDAIRRRRTFEALGAFSVAAKVLERAEASDCCFMQHTARRFWLSECTGPRAKNAVDIEDRVIFYRLAAAAAQAERTTRGETLEIRSLPEICCDVALLGQEWRSRDDSEDAWDAIDVLEAEHMEATATQLQAGDSTIGDYGLVEADPETDLLAPSESFVRAGECLFFSARRVRALMSTLGLLGPGPPDDVEMCPRELPRVSAPQFALAHAGRTINDSISRTLESKAVEFVRGEWMFKICAPLGVIDAFMNENGVSYATFTEACAENAREVSSFIRGGTFDAVEDIVQAATDHTDDNRYLFAVVLLLVFLLDNGPAGLGGKAEESLIVLETHIDEMRVPSAPRDGAQIICALGAWFVRSSEQVYRADDPIAALWQWATLTQTHYALKALSGRASSKRRSLPKKHGT